MRDPHFRFCYSLACFWFNIENGFASRSGIALERLVSCNAAWVDAVTKMPPLADPKCLCGKLVEHSLRKPTLRKDTPLACEV